MNADAWTNPVSKDEAQKRAGGRRSYNARRQNAALLRQHQIADLLRDMSGGLFDWGFRSELSRKFGVSRATITRDLQHLMRLYDSIDYAIAYLDFARWHRRDEGQSLGPRPGTTFRQMRRK